MTSLHSLGASYFFFFYHRRWCGIYCRSYMLSCCRPLAVPVMPRKASPNSWFCFEFCLNIQNVHCAVTFDFHFDALFWKLSAIFAGRGGYKNADISVFRFHLLNHGLVPRKRCVVSERKLYSDTAGHRITEQLYPFLPTQTALVLIHLHQESSFPFYALLTSLSFIYLLVS